MVLVLSYDLPVDNLPIDFSFPTLLVLATCFLVPIILGVGSFDP